MLMLSELATNAVQHAATEFEVGVRVAPDGHLVRVEVSDAAAGFPTPQEQIAEAPHGRGLHIVRTLADAWGIEMRTRPGPARRSGSRCRWPPRAVARRRISWRAPLVWLRPQD